MRKIVIEFTVPEEYDEDYADVCTELVIEDFLGEEVASRIRILSDAIVTENKTNMLIKNI